MIYFCADDYGLSKKPSQRIENCINNGALNKISVLPNGDFDDLKLCFNKTEVRLSLHINLVEGKPLSSPDKVPVLISDDGYFRHSFVGLWMMSLSPKRKKLEKQLYEEICMQLKFWKQQTAKDAQIAIDSHQHVHMIPLVFKTLMQAIKDEGVSIGYIRIPSEPIIPYLKEISLYHTYNPVNIIKQWLLKFLSFANRKQIKKAAISPAYVMGILFSGKMDTKRIKRLLPRYKKLADKNSRDIELIFHPGYLEKEENLCDTVRKDFEKFYLSDNRRIEYDTLMNPEFKE